MFLLWIGLAAVGAGLTLLAWPEMPFGAAVLVFITLLAGGIAVGLRLRRITTGTPQVNLPGSAVIGRIGIVTRRRRAAVAHPPGRHRLVGRGGESRLPPANG